MIGLVAAAGGGDFVVTPNLGVTVSAIVMVGAIVGALFMLVRRLRRPLVVSGKSVSARWVKVSRALVDLFLVVYAISALVFAASLALGSTSTTFGGDRLEIGAGRIEMQIDATVFGGYGGVEYERVRKRELRNYAEWYGTGATPVNGRQVHLVADDPNGGLWALALLTFGVGVVAVVTFLLALRAVLAHAEAGVPFDLRSVAALRWMAVALGGGAMAVNLGTWLLAKGVIANGGGQEAVFFDPPLGCLIAAVVVLALAEVWRLGAAMQHDVEATI